MQEKTEWELVDEPTRRSGSQRQSQQEHAQQRGEASTGLKQILQAIMGPWWRWKLLGAGIVAALALVTVAMLTGVVAMVAAVAAALAIVVGKVRQWTRRHGTALMP